MSVCPGSCNTQWRLAEKQNKPHELTPKQGAPVWCPSCSQSIEAALRALPRDAALVVLEMEHGTPRRAERVSGSRERPLHPREGLAEIIDFIHEVLTGWESDVREKRSLTPPAQGRRGKRIEKASRFLIVHLEWILAKHEPEAAMEFGKEILAAHRRAQKATHNTEPKIQRCAGVRCPRCTWKALVWEMDENRCLTGFVVCENCKTLLTEGEYREHVKKEAK